MLSFPKLAKSTGKRHGHMAPQFRPNLEVLEGRDLPSGTSLAPMPPPWVQTFHGDFNGDGKQDVAGIDSSGQWWVSLSTGTSFTPRTMWARWSIPSAWTKLFVADVNGDGKDDIVGFGFNGAWFAGISDGTGKFVWDSSWAQWSNSSSWSQLFVGDFNGDGKADIAGMGNNGTWFVGLSNGSNTFVTGAAWAQWSIAPSWSQLFVGDFNGDHKADIAGFGYNGTWFVGISNGVNAFTTGAAWAQWSVPSTWSQFFVADFNGDGKADIAGYANNGAWFVGLSNGANTFSTGAAWGYFDALGTAQVFVGDVNGDGKADIVSYWWYTGRFSPPGEGSGIWIAGTSNGLDTFSTMSWSPVATWNRPNAMAQLFVADFTGDGVADAAGFAIDNSSSLTSLNVPNWCVGPSNKTSFGSQTGWVGW